MEHHGRSIASIRSSTLALPPSCIEFCPAHPDFFVVGTYNLQKDEESPQEQGSEQDVEDKHQTSRQPQSRNGSLLVFKLDGNEVQQVQTLLQPSALLDLHFHPKSDNCDVLAVVSSTGTLSFFKFALPSADSASYLTEISSHRPLGDDESVLLLSCCWHPKIPELIAVTASNYEVHILRVNETWNVSDTSQSAVLTHSLEAWTVAFSPNLSKPVDFPGDEREYLTIFSGGDDSKLLQTSCRYHPQENIDNVALIEGISPTIGFKGHQAGVTAILPLEVRLNDLHEDATLMLTGSYDDHIRAYAVYKHSVQPRLLAEENLGGGVWRLKLISLGNENQVGWSVKVLASCMHAGSRILKVTGDRSGSCEMEVVARFEEHKSMNYGSDFQPGSELSGRPLRCVSTSFYDTLMCLWEFN